MTKPLVRTEAISKSYGDNGRIEVLADLTVDIEAGETIAVIGQSGVGKSTLLHILGTLDTPSAGKVWFDGVDVFALDENRQAALRNKEIGFVFQFHHLLPDFTALENVMMPALIAGQTKREAEAPAQALLERVGLASRVTHRPGELSGGEQQRVAIARALALRPRLILADEPSGNLDPATADSVHDLLVELNRERGVTMVIVTHNEALAARMHRILRLQQGKLQLV